LDDAGFADVGREAANELFRVVCARYRERSTIVYVMWNLAASGSNDIEIVRSRNR
jgi:hypothetical protein